MAVNIKELELIQKELIILYEKIESMIIANSHDVNEQAKSDKYKILFIIKKQCEQGIHKSIILRRMQNISFEVCERILQDLINENSIFQYGKKYFYRPSL